ncbi:MAG: hypothetical protein D6724_10835 [Armatimonadetes bacterium]|nr:MAG: hypothetical protein D6724_10835 [Armatimonadota bacterium]
MRKKISKKALVLFAALLAAAPLAVAQLKIDIGDLLKIGGIALVVDRFGPEIDKAVDDLQGFTPEQAAMTKVVPIISAGSGTHVGAAQVMGPASEVNKVRAVAQVEGKVFGGVVRIKALIPVSTTSVTNIRRVDGVGVSAIIDVKI